MRILVEIDHGGGWITEGWWTDIAGETAVVHTNDLAYMPLYFHLVTGKHNTWGQGRCDWDEYPRLTPASLAKVQNTVVW